MKNTGTQHMSEQKNSSVQFEDEQLQTTLLTQLVNSADSFNKCISVLTSFLRHRTDCEAVGIRLRSGEDYPYYETCGFPPAFVEAENYLCSYSKDGTLLHDSDARPTLECMCGNILRGRYDPAKPYFTSHGSFWSNYTSALLTSDTELTGKRPLRNRCFREGYESIALIPMHTATQVYGLLQINDHCPGRFTSSLINLLEKMADGIAPSLEKRQSRDAHTTNENV